MARVAVVTGGTAGIGFATCRRLLSEGRSVAALYASDERQAEAARQETGLICIKCDVSKPEQCRAAVEEVETRLGVIDILVNNAGITWDGSLHKMSDDAWDRVLQVGLYGVFHMSRAVIEGMRNRQFGRIVSISSINGQKGQFGQTNYSAAKAGVIGFTKALALEGARKGVTVNSIAPGYVDTAMLSGLAPDVLDGIKASIPVGRLGRPEEIARCVSFLAADDAGFITGAVISVNGGQYMMG
jgi:acetoacetyl-CoA reductase